MPRQPLAEAYNIPHAVLGEYRWVWVCRGGVLVGNGVGLGLGEGGVMWSCIAVMGLGACCTDAFSFVRLTSTTTHKCCDCSCSRCCCCCHRSDLEPNWMVLPEMPEHVFIAGLRQRNWTNPDFK